LRHFENSDIKQKRSWNDDASVKIKETLEANSEYLLATAEKVSAESFKSFRTLYTVSIEILDSVRANELDSKKVHLQERKI